MEKTFEHIKPDEEDAKKAILQKIINSRNNQSNGGA
jgi:hypothetical protein